MLPIFNNFIKETMESIPQEIILWGGTGQCKVVRTIIEYYGSKVVAVVDDTLNLEPPFNDIPLYLGKQALMDFYNDKCKTNLGFVVTIGNNKTCKNSVARKNISEFLESSGFKPVTVIHPSAIIDYNVRIGKSCQILAGAVLISHSKVEDYCIINTGASLDHECILETGVELGPNATLCGQIQVGKNSWIAANATILPKLNIGSNSVIGSGSVITKNVPDGVIMVGNPARILRNIDQY